MEANADKQMFDYLNSKLIEFEHYPNTCWMRYGSSMPICTLDGNTYQGGSAFLLEQFMEKHKFRIPVFVQYMTLRSSGLSLKPNQRAVPLPQPRILAVNNWTGEKILDIEYDKLSSAEKEDYNLLLDMKVQYVFNVEQTLAEKSHTTLYDEWQEHYAGAPPTYMPRHNGYLELDNLIEGMRYYYPGYFLKKPTIEDYLPEYYCKCAQTLAYLSYKSLPITHNDAIRNDSKLALFASEMAGSFICSKYGLQSIPNQNFIDNISYLRTILAGKERLSILFGQIDQICLAFEQALNRYRDRLRSEKKISGYMSDLRAKSCSELKKVYEQKDLSRFSIKAALDELRSEKKEESGEGIKCKRKS